MTDPTPTRAEVEAQRRAVSFLRSQHAQICFERGDHKDEVDTPWSRGADAIEQCAALRDRAQAAEAERKAADFRLVDRYRNPKTGIFNFPDDVAAIVLALDEARRAEDAAWNDAIEAVRPVALASFASGCDAHELDEDIRALRRAAPTEGEA